MKILFIVNNFPPGGAPGGIVTYVSIMARAWQQAGHEVSVICQSATGKREEENQEGIRVLRVLPKVYPGEIKDRIGFKLSADNSKRVIYQKEFSQAAYDEMLSWSDKPDLIECCDAFGWAWAFFKQQDIPVMIRVHGPNKLASLADPDNADIKAKALCDLESDCLRQASSIIVPTEYMKDYVLSEGAKVKAVIPNPYDFQQGLSADKDPFQLVAVGRLIPGKGMETAIRVLKDLDKLWHLRLIGPDAKWGPKGRSGGEQLKNLANELGVSKRIDFVGQIQDKSELYKILAQSNILIHDSKNDNMPYVLLEALAQHTKVVASKVGGIPETLINDLSCCVAQGDVAAYVEAINEMKDFDSSLLEEYRQRHCPKILQKLVEKEYISFLKG